MEKSTIKPILRMEKISKSFPGVKALDEVDLDVYPGEVLALVGENGAGKTTLMEILNPHPAPTGFYKQDKGKIFFKEKEINPRNPKESQALGISFIHQHFNLAPNLTVAENIFLGREPDKFKILPIINEDEMARRTRDILSHIGEDISPQILVGDLGVAQKQIVEIAKAISQDAQLIIMDEPTASLDRDEIKKLFGIVRNLKTRGISTIFITHKLEEVFEIADRVTVLRDGKCIGTMKSNETDIPEVVKMMVGRELTLFPKSQGNIDDVILEVKNVSRGKSVRNASFYLKKGEILGIAGMVGAGRTELARVLFGIDRMDSGRILLNGKELSLRTPRDALRSGIGMVPEDRQLEGLILLMSVKENISLPNLNSISPWGIINRKEEQKLSNYYMKKLAIQTPDMDQLVIGLSGGNQQKVVLAKWLALQPKLLILDEPTRGIDVGAKADVHALMSEIVSQGVGIIMISSEMPEILAMSDRIIVMSKGKITGEFSREDADQEKIMNCAI
ncbi:sugar ABC transporter ATP-binding protein [Candidatus Poribacteria bacterium]|nr:sugar ABC transporter ATP-binding protein [Candidatus Poribacteria bacterium]